MKRIANVFFGLGIIAFTFAIITFVYPEAFQSQKLATYVTIVIIVTVSPVILYLTYFDKWSGVNVMVFNLVATYWIATYYFLGDDRFLNSLFHVVIAIVLINIGVVAFILDRYKKILLKGVATE